LKVARALAQFGNGDALGYAHDCIAHLLHRAANGTPRFVRAGTLLIELLTDATNRGQRALDVTHNRSERDLFRRLARR